MPVINVALQTSVRTHTKGAMRDILRGKVKTGKETVRDARQRLMDRSLRRHKVIMAKFVSEEGRGTRISFEA